MMWHPYKYASILAEKIQKHQTAVWLVNTGWTAGGYGVGHRMKLSHTRAIIDAIHDGSLLQAEYVTTRVFNLQAPTSCNNVPSNVLQPESQVLFLCYCSVLLKGVAEWGEWAELVLL